MKSWSHLCFLVLAITSVTRGQRDTSDSSRIEEGEGNKGSPPPLTQSPPLELPNENRTEVSSTTPATPSTPATPATPATLSSQKPIMENRTYLLTEVTMPKGTTKTDKGDDSLGTEGSGGSTGASVPGSAGGGAEVGATTVSTETRAKSDDNKGTGSSSLGYVILVLIFVAIIALCVILFFLRRVTRTYSFDLQRPDVMIQQLNTPTATFEPVYLDDLDRPVPKDQVTLTTNDLSPPPVANGTSLQPEEMGSNGENAPLSPAPQEQPDANGLEASPPNDTGPTSGNDPADTVSNTSSRTNLFFDATVAAPQNENNNNPSIFSSDPFVEINLDEPASCVQLLTSPEATSSVFPFASLSFPSSSSSSS